MSSAIEELKDMLESAKHNLEQEKPNMCSTLLINKERIDALGEALLALESAKRVNDYLNNEIEDCVQYLDSNNKDYWKKRQNVLIEVKEVLGELK